MKIAIIGAMDIEVETLRKLIENPHTKTLYQMPITEGTIEDKQIVVAQCFPGKVNAAICAQTIVINNQPDQIINIGVAGGYNHMKIGDAAVAKEFVQHDVDTTPLGDPMGLVPGIGLVHIPSDQGIYKNLIKATEKANIDVHQSIFATGDQFVTPEKIEFIRENFETEIFEMEGGAIAHVCHRANIPFGAVRVVSDNGHAQAQYETFKFEAAEECARIVSEYLKLIRL